MVKCNIFHVECFYSLSVLVWEYYLFTLKMTVSCIFCQYVVQKVICYDSYIPEVPCIYPIKSRRSVNFQVNEVVYCPNSGHSNSCSGVSGSWQFTKPGLWPQQAQVTPTKKFGQPNKAHSTKSVWTLNRSHMTSY